MDGQFARDAENPIAADAVVIDEVGARDPREMAMTIRSKREMAVARRAAREGS